MPFVFQKIKYELHNTAYKGIKFEFLGNKFDAIENK